MVPSLIVVVTEVLLRDLDGLILKQALSSTDETIEYGLSSGGEIQQPLDDHIPTR
jgi:hypothetical protein